MVTSQARWITCITAALWQDPRKVWSRRGATRYSMSAMWGSVELEPEVRDWIVALADTEADRVRFHIDRLAELGPLLDEPHTRQLDGKLCELRFHLEGRQMRVTYWIAPGRRIILLTVFAKTQRQERREISRAKEAMERCVAEAHTIDDEV
jgi:hypothetical protein